MKIQIDLDRLSNNSLSPNSFVYLYSVINNLECHFELSEKEYKSLQTNGFIKVTSEGVHIRAKAKNLFSSLNMSDKDGILELVKKYRDLFPSGVKTSGYLVKGDLQACIKKMKEFKSKYDFTDEEILETTRIFLEVKRKENYRGTQLAHFFIEKDGISNLASLCEDYRERSSKGITIKDSSVKMEGI